jgi:hypothetical protein
MVFPFGRIVAEVFLGMMFGDASSGLIAPPDLIQERRRELYLLGRNAAISGGSFQCSSRIHINAEMCGALHDAATVSVLAEYDFMAAGY